MRASIIAAGAFAASLALTATAGHAVTFTSIAFGGVFGVEPPAIDITAPAIGDPPNSLNMAGSLDGSEASIDFTYTAIGALRLEDITISATGQLAEMALISISKDNGATGPATLTLVEQPVGTGTGFGGSFFESYDMADGETVTLTFTDTSFVLDPILGALSSISQGVPIGLSAKITNVPVPAGLPMLLAALGGVAVLRSRRKADA